MRVERVHLHDIGPFDDVTIDFPPGTDPNVADVYLLTGPNGSGKSTVLYALASILSEGTGDLGPDLLSPRMRSSVAVAAAQIGGVTAAVAYTADSAHKIPDPLGGNPLRFRDRNDDRGFYRADGAALEYRALTQQVAAFDRPQFTWAAFAYAGLRSLADIELTGIKPTTESPFENSLSFSATTETSNLANWIANQKFRMLKAKEAGDVERAAELARSVTDIERIVGEAIDDPDFRFVASADDDNILVRWQGANVRFGVLPDGLKSIVSWIADLLMRLDRIPWRDHTPVLQRSFLLLLDEVDIHLHPAWQRRVLPLVQKMFPNAQIIATTHSPFVVASVSDARIITLDIRNHKAVVTHTSEPQQGVSYTAVLRSIFGVTSEFDIDTEDKLAAFHAAKKRLLSGDLAAEPELQAIAAELARRSEELREIVALELGQLRRQRAAAP